jgi:hypothetical protein
MPQFDHSKTPWFITQSRSGLYIAKDGGGIVACAIDSYCTSLDEAQADAAFIVKAVNAYEANTALIAKLTEALEPFAAITDIEEEVGRDDPDDDRILIVQAHGCLLTELEIEDFRRARAALSLAKSETPQ